MPGWSTAPARSVSIRSAAACLPKRGPQTRQALSNLAAVLAGAGSTLERVIKATVYTRDAGMFGEMDAVFAEVFGTAKPARTTIPGLAFRAGVDVEIDLLAALG